MKRRGGFTLIELLVASSMLAVLAAAGYVAFAAGMRASDRARRVNSMVAGAQRALTAMAADIRAMVEHEDWRLMTVDSTVEGQSSDMMDFVTTRHRRSFAIEATGRCEVGYSLAEESETGTRWLARRQDDTPDEFPDEGGDTLPLVPNVSELDLEYYDGTDWLQEWTDTQSFPRAIHIDIVVVDPDAVEDPMQFETTVCIPTREGRDYAESVDWR